MRIVFRLALFAIMLLPVHQVLAQVSVEQASTDIIEAYKTKDVDLLKKYATGVIMYVINEGFYESDDAMPLVEIAEKWDGKIKEIRYTQGDMMGKTILLASVYFSDNPNGNLNAVLLSSYEDSEWKAFALGIGDIPKEEFYKGSVEIPTKDSAKESVSIKNDHSEFLIEMANGDSYESPSTEKLKELLGTLDDDNFFLTLNGKNGFLQTSTSEQGYIVQYGNDNGMFEAEAYFTVEMLTEIFVTYIDNDETWKDKSKWVEM